MVYPVGGVTILGKTSITEGSFIKILNQEQVSERTHLTSATILLTFNDWEIKGLKYVP